MLYSLQLKIKDLKAKSVVITCLVSLILGIALFASAFIESLPALYIIFIGFLFGSNLILFAFELGLIHFTLNSKKVNLQKLGQFLLYSYVYIGILLNVEYLGICLWWGVDTDWSFTLI